MTVIPVECIVIYSVLVICEITEREGDYDKHSGHVGPESSQTKRLVTVFHLERVSAEIVKMVYLT